MNVKELVGRCAQEVLKLSLDEGLDALDKQRVYGNALIECVRRHFLKKCVPDEVGYNPLERVYWAKKKVLPTYDVWGGKVEEEVVILKFDWCPQDVEGEIERLKKEEVAFCFIDWETQKALEDELQKYVCLDCNEHKNTPALMCWRASYMEEKSPIEEWNEVARKLRKEWEEERKAWEREKAQREDEKREKLLKGEAYVVSVFCVMNDKKITKFYYLERQNGKLVLKVPKWLAGHVIGKGGQRIKRLQEFLGERVYIETYDDVAPRKIELSFGW